VHARIKHVDVNHADGDDDMVLNPYYSDDYDSKPPAWKCDHDTDHDTV
jgi:hypothetical protein